jgi:hypothetical protein
VSTRALQSDQEHIRIWNGSASWTNNSHYDVRRNGHDAGRRSNGYLFNSAIPKAEDADFGPDPDGAARVFGHVEA